MMFQHGDVIGRVNVPVPASVLEKLRNPALDASASATTIAASIEALPDAEAEVDPRSGGRRRCVRILSH